ncbi:hypothetical protein ACI01nite_26450 [Acetobacter cibinongensis]|uniref:Uncharacterized protein n=1 Tax=Acetobacter cibinongensis TaxID=146475 RepID=A0A0D6N317_9PROT|nr:hypothetical protein [Acetobacter cibinongensis]GAN60115.1 hypothetical protein Abci_009_020 [Acetobacter cibinongensis]GBQ11710.1 hypothetical protein AA0482_0018 [Acetobacter cibinongensis NRIC 0482]GEL60043.1 hypothetical protein ACI01nite_26450 [Acetobacter cibinongensis]
MSARIAKDALMTAWVHGSGRIEFRPGVGFPDGMLPLCCGTRDAIRTALKARAWNGQYYAVPGITDQLSDQQAYECMEKLRVSLTGTSPELISYYSAMNRRDV